MDDPAPLAPELYGSEPHVALQQRLYRLWPFLRADARLSCNGRAVGFDAVGADPPTADTLGHIDALVAEFGFTALAQVWVPVADRLQPLLDERGFVVERRQDLIGGEAAATLCRRQTRYYSLPDGYRFERVTADSPADTVRDVQELMLRNGVAPLPGYVLRGRVIPAVAEAVIGPDDALVAVGAAVASHHREGPIRRGVHIGFLSTAEAERGRGLARVLLARLIVAAFDELGAALVRTGVPPDNTATQRVCRSCGLADSERVVLAVMDSSFGEGAFTR